MLGVEQTALDAVQRLARHGHKGEGARRGVHAARCPHEQRIVEIRAQPAERGADTRLAHAQPFGCAADVARLFDGDQIRDQIQIEVVEREVAGF